MSDKKGGLGFRKKLKAHSEVEQYQKLIKKEPENERAYIRLAELYARLGEDEQALEVYEQTALLLEKKGFLTKARAILRQALAIDPEHGRINVLLADIDRGDGLDRDAAIRYQTAANYYIKIGDKQVAITILRKIIEIFPNNVPTVLKLGHLLVNMQMNQDAVALLAPLTKKLQNTDRKTDYITILKLLYSATEGTEPLIALKLVDTYIENNDYTKALSVLQTIIMHDATNVEYLKRLVTLFQHTDEPVKLIAAYKQLASALKKHGRNSEKDAVYQKILELNPGDTEALEVLNERDTLRHIISDKIEDASDDEDDILIEIDMNEDETLSPPPDILTLPSEEEMCEKEIGESIAFRKYSLFEKAEKAVLSSPLWKKSTNALDQLIEIAIEQDEVEKAFSYMSILMDLFLDRQAMEKARELLEDMQSMCGEDEGVIHYRRLIEAFGQDDDSAVEDTLSESEKMPTENDALRTEDILGDLTDDSAILSDDIITADKNEGTKKLDEVLSDIFDDVKEPPQSALDELEFYISIEDFESAIILLQDLLASYPNSLFLSEMKSTLPGSGGEDIADTLTDVRDSLQEMGDGTADSDYDLGMMYRSMNVFPDALMQFSSAQQKEPSNIKYRMAVVDTLIDLNQIERALSELESALVFATDEQKIEIENRLKTLRK
ncbi:tetratricopeptide repeat protein [bacterium]|nr:tetratricopeptide repeat protein [bacterium]